MKKSVALFEPHMQKEYILIYSFIMQPNLTSV